MSNASKNLPPDDSDSVNRPSTNAERTLLGNDVSDDDEMNRPPSDRSPLTPGSTSESDR